MGILGAVYMTFLAILIIKSKDPSEEKADERINSFFTGLSLQFINPKLLLYAITVSSNFIVPYYKSNMILFLFTIFLSSLILISVSLWALFGALFKKFLSRYRKPFNLVMGLLLLYGAISISGILELLN
jgi:threonine/homoserine/homoserine lactone efflux protein